MAPEQQRHLRPQNHPLPLHPKDSEANPQGRRGVPGIIGFSKRDGVFIGVEVKAGRDQLRPEQKQFLDELRAAGGLPFVAHSFAQFQQSFERRWFYAP